ncbi:MAG: hypothetical protein JSW58_17500 [Candidatus Latescibacterota bacterium]|nr:MAG: hypothetical protein JSW58_17500 [Candidatus Latescibacterota bacterium]
MMYRFTAGFAFFLIAAALVPSPSSGQIVDLCGSDASSNGGCIRVCPKGDGDHLSDIGATIYVTVISQDQPIPNIPAADFWLIGCDPLEEMVLCSGSASSNADHPTDQQGQTTISGPIAAGGCSDGLALIVQGIIIPDPDADCSVWLCLPINARSSDLDGNNIVDLPDLALFAAVFVGGPYDKCMDLNCDGSVGLQDLALFAEHFEPVRHRCL